MYVCVYIYIYINTPTYIFTLTSAAAAIAATSLLPPCPSAPACNRQYTPKTIPPVFITRFPSFRTQTLENLSRYQ